MRSFCSPLSCTISARALTRPTMLRRARAPAAASSPSRPRSSPRHHVDARAYRSGEIGARLKRALEESEDFDDLMLLRQLDDAGRVPGAVVGTLDEALNFLKEL